MDKAAEKAREKETEANARAQQERDKVLTKRAKEKQKKDAAFQAILELEASDALVALRRALPLKERCVTSASMSAWALALVLEAVSSHNRKRVNDNWQRPSLRLPAFPASFNSPVTIGEILIFGKAASRKRRSATAMHWRK